MRWLLRTSTFVGLGFALATLALVGCATSMPSSPVTYGAKSLFVVTQPTSNTVSVLELPATGNGNVTPLSTQTLTIAGGVWVAKIVRDSSGQLYVGTRPQVLGLGLPQVLVYAAGATGTAVPIRTITGGLYLGRGTFSNLEALAVDNAGTVYVSDHFSISIFSAKANGAVLPDRYLYGPLTQVYSGGLQYVYTIFAGSTGELFVGTLQNVLVYSATANGNVAPTQTISGIAQAITTDASGNLYVTGFVPVYSVIREYAAGTGTLIRTISAPDQRRTPSLRLTYQFSSLQTDSVGNLYAAGQDADVIGSGSVSSVVGVFGPNASDGATLGYTNPNATITSSAWNAYGEIVGIQ